MLMCIKNRIEREKNNNPSKPFYVTIDLYIVLDYQEIHRFRIYS